MSTPPPAAYCGAPPSPAELWARWNLDPALILALIAVFAFYLVGARRAGLVRARRSLFAVGWTATGLALISPLCALSVSLFAARVGQHMFLTCAAAPLVALGRPAAAARALFTGRRPAVPSPVPASWAAWSPLVAATVFAGALWYWHTPGPYAVTFASVTVYWLMHVTLFGSALWLWSALLDHADQSLAAGLAAVFLTGLQMSLLGAVITFASHPLYAPHMLTTAGWGLTRLEDQQLGGALMWVPAGVIFVGALVLGLARLFDRAEHRALRHSPA
jgi:putative membrane protein